MPVKWSYRASILVVETIGVYSREELSRALVEARHDSQFRPDTRVLFDGRLSEADISTPDIDWRVQLVSGLRSMGFAKECAVVVRDKPVTFGLGRMLSMRLENEEGIDLQVTRDFDDAMRWLAGKDLR